MAAYTTIDNPELYFQAVIYTGNGGTNAITLPGSENMSPNLVWCAERDSTSSPKICDTLRGTETVLRPDGTTAEATDGGVVTSFDSDGFTHGADNGINENTRPNVGWCWVESVTAGFDIDLYAGNTTSGRTEAHSLSAVPHFMIVRCRNNGDNWMVYHHKVATSNPETYWSQLNTTAASSTSGGTGIWNDTAPTSSVFTLGNSGTVNEGYNYVAYLWTGKQGFSKFGSYTGNGNANGTFVYTGFRPAWIVMKRTNNTGEWGVFDNKRDPFNKMTTELKANSHEAEEANGAVDFLSNGFKLRDTAVFMNGSADTYMYMAFAEAPFVNSSGVPANAR